MAQTAMTVRMDATQKKQFDSLCEQFGMSANTAINVFVKAVIRNNGIPFSIEGEKINSVRANAIESFKSIRARAEASPEPEMSLEEINAEITAARKALKKTNA